MIENTVHIRFKDNPVLLDKVLQDIQAKLLEKLTWLNYAFGRAYRLVEHRPDGNKFIYPAAYNGNGEYVSLVPNDNFGNFAWFDIFDPQDVIEVSQALPQYTFRGALIIWYDQSSIYEDATVLHTEDIKNEVMQILTAPGLISSTGRISINRIYERFENLYAGYSIEKIYNNFAYKGDDIQDIDKQFFMYPYAGLRIEFSITTRELCQRYIR